MLLMGLEVDNEFEPCSRLALDQGLRSGTGRGARPGGSRLEARSPVRGTLAEIDFVRRRTLQCHLRPMLVVPGGDRLHVVEEVRRTMAIADHACRCSFKVRIKRSTTAMLPCWPTAPKR